MTTQVATVFWVMAIGFDHHRHRVPTHVGAQAFFYFDIAGAMDFLVWLNGVDIASIG